MRSSTFIAISTLTALALFAGGAAHGDERDWCGEAGDEDWSNQANWKNGTAGSYVFNSGKTGCGSISTYNAINFKGPISISEDVWMEYGMTFKSDGGNGGLTVANAKSFMLGCNDATFTIDGGTYSFVTMVRAAENKTATMDLKSGVLNTRFDQYSGKTGNLVFLFNGGTLKPLQGSSNFFKCGSTKGTAYVKVGAAGGTIDTAYDVVVTQAIEDYSGETAIGTLTKKGAGTLTLAGTVGCNLSISEGALVLTNSARTVSTMLTFAQGTALVVNAESVDHSFAYNVAFADGAGLSDMTVFVADPDSKAWTADYSEPTQILTLTRGEGTVACWTGGAADTKWSTADNWSTGRAPNSSETDVVFPLGTHAVTLACNNSDNNDICGKMTVLGNVTLSRATSGTWAYFNCAGDIDGTGSVTFKAVGCHNTGSKEKTVSCAVVIDGSGSNDDTFFSTKAWHFTGAFKVTGTGCLKADGVTLAIDGAATLENGAKIECGSAVTFNGLTTMEGTVIKHKSSQNAGTKSDLIFGEIFVPVTGATIQYTHADSGSTKLTGTIHVAAPDSENDYPLLTIGNNASGKVAVDPVALAVADAPETGVWRTKWVGNVLTACYVKPGFVIVVGGSKVPLDDDSDLTTWLSASGVDAASATEEDFLVKQNAKGISPLAAYLLGYDAYSEATQPPALTATVTTDGFAIAYDLAGKTTRTIDGLVFQYGIEKSTDRRTWTVVDETKTTGTSVTLKPDDAGLYNRLVATVVQQAN